MHDLPENFGLKHKLLAILGALLGAAFTGVVITQLPIAQASMLSSTTVVITLLVIPGALGYLLFRHKRVEGRSPEEGSVRPP